MSNKSFFIESFQPSQISETKPTQIKVEIYDDVSGDGIGPDDVFNDGDDALVYVVVNDSDEEVDGDVDVDFEAEDIKIENDDR